MSKDKEVHGLMKIPEEAVIASLRVELGQHKAYIDELEERLKIALTLETKDLLNQIHSLKCERKKLHERIKYMQDNDEINRLRRENNELVGRIVQLKKNLSFMQGFSAPGFKWTNDGENVSRGTEVKMEE